MKIRAKLLKDYINAVSKLDGEPCLSISKEGVSTKCVDPAYVSMMWINAPASDDLDITEDATTFCIDAKQFSKYMRSFKADSMLDFTSDGERCRVSDGKIKFTARLLEEKTPPKVPRLTLDANAVVSVKDIKAVMSAKYDTIRISAMDGKLTISAGDEQDAIEVVNDCPKPVNARAQYPADYISNALIGEQVSIEFGNDLPIRITPQLNNLEITVLVAPRIEND